MWTTSETFRNSGDHTWQSPVSIFGKSPAMSWSSALSAIHDSIALRSCVPVRHIEGLLIDLLRPLTDVARADPEIASQLLHADERMQHPLFAALRVLWDELLTLFDEQVHGRRRALLPKEKPIGEVLREARLRRVAFELRHVDHRRERLVDDQIGQQRTTGRLERHVSVQSAEDRDRDVARVLPVLREAQPVPHADRIEDDELRASVPEQLGELGRAVRFAASGDAEPREFLRRGFEREREAVGQFQLRHQSFLQVCGVFAGTVMPHRWQTTGCQLQNSVHVPAVVDTLTSAAVFFFAIARALTTPPMLLADVRRSHRALLRARPIQPEA
jgi:hypothetical protein